MKALVPILLVAVLMVSGCTATGPSKECETFMDCLVYGETGDCNCGCYNKDHLPEGTGGECFCLAPIGCRCLDGECVPIYDISTYEECVSVGLPTDEEKPWICRDPAMSRSFYDLSSAPITDCGGNYSCFQSKSPSRITVDMAQAAMESNYYFDKNYTLVATWDGSGQKHATAHVKRTDAEGNTEEVHHCALILNTDTMSRPRVFLISALMRCFGY